MKKIIILTCSILFFQFVLAQNEFEGIVRYRSEVKSKSPVISDKAISNMLLVGGNMTAYIKKGNYLQSSNTLDLYYINAQQKSFYRFKKIDTLFYMDYNDETNAVISVSRAKKGKSIAGYDCDALVIKTDLDTKTFYYTPMLPLNPEYDKKNHLGKYSVFIQEAKAVWLGYEGEGELYHLSTMAYNVEPKPLEETIFDLPLLPKKKFDYEENIRPAEFKRPGGFGKYLSTALDPSVGAKYIKIGKGEKAAGQTVIVNFMITETGSIADVRVENKKEVHPKLAEEAVRVISSSPAWTPATLFGEKIISRVKQHISFVAERE